MASEYVERVAAAWTEHTRLTEGRPAPETAPPYLYASKWHPCARALALDLIHPEDAGDYDDATLERFYRGNEIERMVIARLILAGRHEGFQVMAQQRRFEIRGREGQVVIAGKVDGELVFDDGTRIDFDVKSGASVQHCETLEDLDRGRWTRHMPYQVLSYCYASEAPRGLLILDKPSGPTWIELVLEEHLDRVERFIAAAEAAVAARAASDNTSQSIWHLPSFHENPNECLDCIHNGKTCAPPLTWGEGLAYITDPETMAAAEAYTRTREAGEIHAAAKKALQKRLRGCELGSIAGRYDVRGKWENQSSMVYPEECSACGFGVVPQKVTDPRGRFKLNIEPAGEGTGDGDG